MIYIHEVGDEVTAIVALLVVVTVFDAKMKKDMLKYCLITILLFIFIG